MSCFSATTVDRPMAVPAACAGPVVHADGTITFCLDARHAAEVRCNFQDMLGPSPASDGFTMQRASADGPWEVTVTPPAPAGCYGYSFTVDGVDMSDPHNDELWTGSSKEHPPPDGALPGGDAWSFVMVPGESIRFMLAADVARGAVTTVAYRSPLAGADRRMRVYTPPEYDPRRAYPVLYLLHGGGGNDTDWTDACRAHHILDNLIAAGAAAPMIVVMPDEHVGNRIAPTSGTITRDDFIEHELLETIIPVIEHDHAVRPGVANRAIAGLSMGSLHARDALLLAPEMFAHYGFFSNGGLSPGQIADLVDNHHDLIDGVLRAQARETIAEIWISEGTEEPIALPGPAGNLPGTLDLLRRYGIAHRFVPGADIGAIYGHVWDTWSRQLNAFAPTLFEGRAGLSAYS